MASLPPGLSYDDPRLPHVVLPPTGLRLNTQPIDASPAADERLAVLRAGLIARCDPWVPAQHRFVDAYLAFLQREALLGASVIEPFDDLFQAEDWLYSGLRPLPRTLLYRPDATLRVDFAFWDGAHVIAVDLRDRPAAERAQLADWGVAWRKAGTGNLAIDTDPGFREIWQDEILPRSPFRGAMPPLA